LLRLLGGRTSQKEPLLIAYSVGLYDSFFKNTVLNDAKFQRAQVEAPPRNGKVKQRNHESPNLKTLQVFLSSGAAKKVGNENDYLG
jgi:hypothetical protein